MCMWCAVRLEEVVEACVCPGCGRAVETVTLDKPLRELAELLRANRGVLVLEATPFGLRAAMKFPDGFEAFFHIPGMPNQGNPIDDLRKRLMRTVR